MKVIEVTKTQRQALEESLERENNTGFSTKDLMQVYDTHVNSAWDCVDADDEIARLDAMIAQDNASTTS